MSIAKQQIAETALFTLEFGKLLIKDIPDARLTERPTETMNHPAWILGHLAYAADGGAAHLGDERALPAAWHELFKGGSTRTGKRTDYPGKDELVAMLDERTRRAAELLPGADDAFLAAELPDERRRTRFGTNGRFLTFLLTAHPGFHFGQLSTWRRAAGLGSAM